MTYYHGSQARITAIASSRDLCLTTDQAIAESYAHYDTPTGGHLHHIDGQLWLADENDLRAAAAETYGRDIDDDEHLFLLADDPTVRDALAAQDYDGVEYGDTDESGADHDCIRVWRTDLLTITRITDIEE